MSTVTWIALENGNLKMPSELSSYAENDSSSIALTTEEIRSSPGLASFWSLRREW